jgi:hypothetical protein
MHGLAVCPSTMVSAARSSTTQQQQQQAHSSSTTRCARQRHALRGSRLLKELKRSTVFIGLAWASASAARSFTQNVSQQPAAQVNAMTIRATCTCSTCYALCSACSTRRAKNMLKALGSRKLKLRAWRISPARPPQSSTPPPPLQSRAPPPPLQSRAPPPPPQS